MWIFIATVAACLVVWLITRRRGDATDLGELSESWLKQRKAGRDNVGRGDA